MRKSNTWVKLHVRSNQLRREFGIFLLGACDTLCWQSKMTQVWVCIYRYAQTYTQAVHFPSAPYRTFVRGGVSQLRLVWPGRIRGCFQKSASSLRAMWISCGSVWRGSASNQQNATDADLHPSLKSLKQAASFLQPSATLGAEGGWVKWNQQA